MSGGPLIGGIWSSISILRIPSSSPGRISHSPPSQSHFRKSHPPAIRMISVREYPGTSAEQSSQWQVQGPPDPSAPSITLTAAAFGTDIFSKKTCRHRFNRSDRTGEACSPDTERPDICTDIDHSILRQDILEPVTPVHRRSGDRMPAPAQRKHRQQW